MQGLNPPQREAIRYLDGPLLVLAGAGSGKTRVITEKIAYLLGECGMAPQHVTAITFTNKAAREMRERATKLVGEPASEVNISTFHALGAKFLRMEARAIGLKPGFSILDASDTAALFNELLKDSDKSRVKLIQQRISLWKNALLGPDDVAPADDLEAGAQRVYAEYERTLKAYQAVDFDDLIMKPVQLLESDEEVAQRWRTRIWHLLVDEYQDTNRCQNRLMRLLTGERATFTAVGDDDQSIYAWRGADVDNLRQLQTDFPRLKVIKLEQNYRSTTRILKAANSVIQHNPKLFDKKLWSDKGHGDVIRVMACRDDQHEAEWVVTRLMAHKFEMRGQGKWRDYAILYRGNFQARLFEQQLRAHKVPYVLSGGQSFFDKSEIKDVTSYLRLLANQDDDPAFIRAATTPKRGIGGTTLEALGHAAGRRHISLFAAIFAPGIEHDVKAPQLAVLREFGNFINRIEYRAQREPAGQVLDDLLKAIGYEAWLFETQEPRDAESRWGNVREFVGWLSGKGEEEKKNLLELAQTVALITMLDKQDENTDAVQLATLHAAKGLEFRHVHLVGVEEGSLPHRESIDKGDIEEERRLMYVGITRAQLSLNLSWCAKRKQGREVVERAASRFIAEMGDDIKHEGQGAVSSAPTFDKAAGNARLANFRALLKKSP
ncbi:MAG: UvrD-helicase domain-containing protein [Pseudomonadota bacterium]